MIFYYNTINHNNWKKINKTLLTLTFPDNTFIDLNNNFKVANFLSIKKSQWPLHDKNSTSLLRFLKKNEKGASFGLVATLATITKTTGGYLAYSTSITVIEQRIYSFTSGTITLRSLNLNTNFVYRPIQSASISNG